jgi:hypothetical protein
MMLPLFAPMVVHVAFAAVILRLPIKARASGSGPWPMVDQLAEGRETSAGCKLRLTPTGLAIESSDAQSLEAPFAALIEVRRDGECLRVRWREDQGERIALLSPAAHTTREGRERFVDLVVERVGRLTPRR